VQVLSTLGREKSNEYSCHRRQQKYKDHGWVEDTDDKKEGENPNQGVVGVSVIFLLLEVVKEFRALG